MRVLAQEIPFVDPLEAFAALGHLPAPVLLDSARVDPALGRWSYVAADPFLLLTSKDGRIRLGDRSLTGDPFAALQRLLRASPLEHDPGAAAVPDRRHRLSGLRSLPSSRAAAGARDRRFALRRPDAGLLRHGCRLRPHRAAGLGDVERVAGNLARTADASPTGAVGRAHRQAGRKAQALDQPSSMAAGPVAAGSPRPAYEAMVQRVVDYILAGDIFQANVSQRFTRRAAARADPFGLYRRLRARNPAPFAAFMDFGDDGDRLGLARALPAAERAARSRRGRSRARARVAPTRARMPRWRPSCWPAKRTAPRT